MKLIPISVIFVALTSCLPGTARAGDPVPGIDISVEQIPGSGMKTASDCTKRGGKAVTRNGLLFCSRPKEKAAQIKKTGGNPEAGPGAKQAKKKN